MPEGKISTYLRTHRLRGKTLSFLLAAEDDELRERAESAKTGRAAKTLVKEGPLRITLVALKQGTTLQSHHVAGPVSLVTIRGLLRVSTAAGDIDIPKDGLIALDAGVGHSVTALDDCAVLITLAME